MVHNCIMLTPILATKLYIPPSRSNLIRRHPLIEQLNEGLQQQHGFVRKLTLISAPAGFGKTTLVTSWIHQLRLETTQERQIENQVAWLSLDEHDNEDTRFLTYLVAALQTVMPMLGDGVLHLLQSPQPPSPISVLTTLINEIATIPDKFLLVLDDYHVLEAPAIDKMVTFLLDHLPSQMHLVITTREDPPLPIPRLRVRGQLLELRANDLRFTVAETAVFLNQMMGLNLTDDEVAVLEARTEGWIAGLQMAALSMQGRADSTAFIEAFRGSHRFVLDYLIEEVLHNQPERVRNFLLQTAVLDRLTGSLCDTVTEQDDGKRMLESLERGNLFVVPLDDQRQWYRYHHLFGDVLQARLLQEQPDQLPTLHRRASNWYEQQGLILDAIHHALAAEDFAHAATLIELSWPTRKKSYRNPTTLSWVKALPATLIHNRPVLCVRFAWALLVSDEATAAEALLQHVEPWQDKMPTLSNQFDGSPSAPYIFEINDIEKTVVDNEQFRSLPATIAITRAYLAQTTRDMAATVKHIERALEYLAEDDYFWRGIAGGVLGLVHWMAGDLERAYDVIAASMESHRLAGHTFMAIGPTAILADIRLAQGQLRKAISVYEQALSLSLAHGEPFMQGTTDLYLGLSELHLERGDEATSHQFLLKTKALGEKAAMPDWAHARARIKMLEGEWDEAIALFKESAQFDGRGIMHDWQPVAAREARIRLQQGKLDDALAWVHQQGLSADDELSFVREYEYITLARVRLAQYQQTQQESALSEAMTLLSRLLTTADVEERMGSVIEILILQALAYEAQGETQRALVPLQRALQLAESEAYVRVFIAEGLPMVSLLQRVKVTEGVETGEGERVNVYVDKLLAAFGEQNEEHSGHPQQALTDPLSERELEVLGLLVTDLTGPEIARTLVVSLNTLRTHTKNIYSKLGANSRRTAVRRAKELGLL